MQKEKIALIALVIIVIAALATFVVALNTPYFENLFREEKIIANGDYADVNYIGYYASNGTIFESSYKYPTNKSEPTPVKIFVTFNTSATPGTNFSAYSPLLNDKFVKGFIENLIGMKQGQTKRTSPISAIDAYGITPKAGDVLNFTVLAGRDYRLSILDIQPNQTMPALFKDYFGNQTTDLYRFREEFHRIGEVIDTYFDSSANPQWVNATVVTKINETKLWKYTTPDPKRLTNLTWVDSNSDTNSENSYTIIYPVNASSINVSSITNSTFVVSHNPKINETISYYNLTYQSGVQFKIRSITEQNITAYYNTTSGNQTTQLIHVFPRRSIILRNQSQNITPVYPKEWLSYVLSMARNYDKNMMYSLDPLADQNVYFNITVVRIYKAS